MTGGFADFSLQDERRGYRGLRLLLKRGYRGRSPPCLDCLKHADNIEQLASMIWLHVDIVCSFFKKGEGSVDGYLVYRE